MSLLRLPMRLRPALLTADLEDTLNECATVLNNYIIVKASK